MKKSLRTSLCMMALLSLEQANAEPKGTKQETKQEAANKDSWAYRNRYNIAGGAALIGAGAAGYLYQNEIADFVKYLTPQQAAEQVAVLEKSIAADLKEVTKQEAVVDAKEHKSEESVAQIETDIAQKQEKIAKEQTWLEYLYKNLTPVSEEINRENKPVNSWGFYTSAQNNRLTPEEEQAGRDERRAERAEAHRKKGTGGGWASDMILENNPLRGDRLTNARKEMNAERLETVFRDPNRHENRAIVIKDLKDRLNNSVTDDQKLNMERQIEDREYSNNHAEWLLENENNPDYLPVEYNDNDEQEGQDWSGIFGGKKTDEPTAQ